MGLGALSSLSSISVIRFHYVIYLNIYKTVPRHLLGELSHAEPPELLNCGQSRMRQRG